jgi:hypothetical protein
LNKTITYNARGRGRKSLPRFFFFTAGVSLLLSLQSCALFESRDSEDPLGEGDGDWFPPLSPAAVIHNWQEAVLQLDRLNYASVFADSGWGTPFHFTPDAYHSGMAEMQNWNQESESFYWDNLVTHMEGRGSFARHQMLFTASDSMLFGDSAIVSGSYDFNLQHGLPDVPEQFSGQMVLALARHLESGDWAMTRCEDTAVDSAASWSVLKREFFLWQ